MEKQVLKSFENKDLRTFGRRHGKKLSPRKMWLIDNLLPKISPQTPDLAKHNSILEIGFGNGEHLCELAKNNPESIIIGAEPFMNGVAALLSRITTESNNTLLDEYKNIRIFPDDVRLLLKDNNFKDIKFSQIWVLHPDPWPKARHEKRRLLNAEFLNLLSQFLSTNGQIIIGTDHWEYYDWIIEQLKQTKIKTKSTSLDTIKTKYQLKNKANTTKPKYMVLSN
ncbi:MAG: tRNA (guanosine(46)-N7)-methyltransferase TrmB [Alphaproteobacteria bacterium]|nr:tRNA (guanosine(46)-N7)-methyltransferase TrmB [Alphaproteobacteria bacterium]